MTTHLRGAVLSFVTAGLVGPGQDIAWISDQDAIAASTRHWNAAGAAFAHHLNHYLSCDIGRITVGTTANDPGDLSVEDLTALPDLAAGAVCDVLTPSGVRERSETKKKAHPVVGWLCDNTANLAKVSVVIRNAPDGRLLMQLLSSIEQR